ncbi:MAG: hypothetical protein ACLFV4_09550 [Candidatus Hydrogenedentota bacterium]
MSEESNDHEDHKDTKPNKPNKQWFKIYCAVLEGKAAAKPELNHEDCAIARQLADIAYEQMKHSDKAWQ